MGALSDLCYFTEAAIGGHTRVRVENRQMKRKSDIKCKVTKAYVATVFLAKRIKLATIIQLKTSLSVTGELGMQRDEKPLVRPN
ncbi:hypothetical protein RJT34_32720 [Clitoria ternatea]|uniref:Uncharacterized protein n=1 Tax=Clitoria ternatea TaxID=43366 RepID=A0AAN9I4U9_CLITE